MNNIVLKSPEEIEILRSAARILKEILEQIRCSLKSGLTTKMLDEVAESLMVKRKVKPAFKGYRGYPSTLCVSVNDEIVHGIPSSKRFIKDGDIVSIDCGLIYKGFYADMALTAGVGTVNPECQRLMDVTKQSLEEGIAQCRTDRRLSDISHAIQSYVELQGFSVVREFVGHGIGRRLHEEPEVANCGYPGRGPHLKAGMVFCLEPMVNAGGWKTKILPDGWTAVTIDGKPSAHFEHMVAVTEDGPSVLTR